MKENTLLYGVASCVFVFLVSSWFLLSAQAKPKPQIITLAISGRANATPSVAAADQFVVVVWGATPTDGATDVYAAVSRDGGRMFRAPARVNDVAGAASLGVEQPPRVALVARAGRDPDIVVVWTAKSKAGTRLLTARSEDGGATFRKATSIAGSEAPGNRGWESIAVDRSGQLVTIWLDHREMAGGAESSSTHHEGHDHAAAGAPKPDGAVHAQLSKLYFARPGDPSSAHAITAGVCYCCKTATAVGPDGSIDAAWRHVYPGNIRDIAFTHSSDGGRTFAAPIRVSNDGWTIDGCPENGPALAVGSDNTVHVLWPTLVSGANGAEPTLGLFYTSTRDGRAFAPRQRIALDGVPRHAQLIAVGRTLVAAWDEEGAGGSRRVVFARATADASPHAISLSREIVSGAARAQNPALASTAGGVLVAWTEGADQSVIRVERR